MEHNGSKTIMMAYKRNTQNGFNIIEVMIAVAISSVLTTTVYQTFHSQQRSYTMQSEAAAMEQNLRGGLYLLSKELRSAGYNPQQTPTDSSAPTTNFRFVTSFPAPNNLFAVNYANDPDFSVVLFRPHFMLVSEEHHMKTHKNQWLLNLLSLPDIPCGATNQVTHYGIWGADACAVI
jgi:prepilin-type N-terminal cleavage/methylation domain-containing protein